MRSERLTYNLGFEILDFLREETNYFVWYPALTGLTWLRNRFLHLPVVLAEFDVSTIGLITYHSHSGLVTECRHNKIHNNVYRAGY